ncbi:lysophospholipase [Fusarium albosuccineum]|uniref:Lysophospholipase n=1 Tax=Fusarium albosuccineum TaxID=1237068 RepID=A0A8H4L403_9HYPO|nr:lysophospholipase [Fusarium albosuccineum]
MEPVEILGASAAALQFANHALKITQFLYTSISKLRIAADVQKQRVEGVSQLSALLHAVICHNVFQTDLVAKELSRCLQDVSRLRDILVKLDTTLTASRWRRYSRKLLALLKDDEINECFAILERDKGSLAIALQNADSRLLSDIGIELTSMHGRVLSMSIVVGKIEDGVEKTSAAVPQVLEKLDTLEVAVSGLKPPEPVQETFTNFPCHRVKDFVGRTGTLVDMRRYLIDEAKSSGPRCAILRGLPGQGKSSTVIEYCRQTLYQPYQAILWIDASSQSSIDYDLTVSAEQILSQQGFIPSTSEGKAFSIFQKLAAGKMQWLVVFDNFDGFQTVPKFKQYLPSVPNASIVITTRRQDVENLVMSEQVVEIEAMNENDALELLCQASRISVRTENHRDLFSARRLVNDLWKNPLAIVQAGLYIHRSRLGFDAFSDIQGDRAMRLLEGSSTHEYLTSLEGSEILRTLTLLTAWDLTLSQVKNEVGVGPKAHKDDLLKLFANLPSRRFSESYLISFCSIMEPWGTSEEMAKEPGSFLAASLQAWDSRAFSDILAEFYDLGLVKHYRIGKDGFYTGEISDMVRDCVRLGLSHETKGQYERIFTDIILHSEASPSKPSSRDTNIEDSRSKLAQLIESWAIPPWEEQIANLILDIWGSGDIDGFDFFDNRHNFSAAIEDLALEATLFRSFIQDADALARLKTKIMCVAQLVTAEPTKEAIDNFLKHVGDAHDEWSNYTESLLTDIVKWLLPIVKVVGLFDRNFLFLIGYMGQNLAQRPRHDDHCKGIQLIKGAFLAIKAKWGFHPDVHAHALYALCWASCLCADYETGEVLARIVVSHCNFDGGGELMAKAMYDLGDSLYMAENNMREAVRILEAASNICAMVLGDTHVEKLRCDARLADALSDIGEPKRGLGLATKTLRTLREHHELIDAGSVRSLEIECLAAQSRCQNKIGQLSQAIQSKRKDLACRRMVCGGEYGYYAGLSMFARMLANGGQTQEAVSTAKETIHGLLELGYPESNEYIRYAYGTLRQLDDHGEEM